MAAILKIENNRDISNCLSDFEFGLLVYFGFLKHMGKRKIKIYKSKTSEGCHFENEHRHLPFSDFQEMCVKIAAC